MCVGVQSVQAQEYGIGIYDIGNEIFKLPTTSSSEIKYLYNYGYGNDFLYKDCDNKVLSFFVYDKTTKTLSEAEKKKIPEANTKEYKEIVDTLPKIEVIIINGELSPSKSPNQVIITSSKLGECNVKVSCMFKNKKITQDFVFKIIPIPAPFIVFVDENSKYLNPNNKRLAINAPATIDAILIYTDDTFETRCPKDAQITLSCKITHVRNSYPVSTAIFEGEKPVDLSKMKAAMISEDILIINNIVFTRVNAKGEKVNDVKTNLKFMVFGFK